jgi:hypothetical protein
VLRLCEVYPGICLTTEEKARKILSQGTRRMPVCKELENASLFSVHEVQITQDLKARFEVCISKYLFLFKAREEAVISCVIMVIMCLRY